MVIGWMGIGACSQFIGEVKADGGSDNAAGAEASQRTNLCT